MLDPQNTVDEYGLPLGSARDAVLHDVCRHLLSTAAHESALHTLITEAVDIDDDLSGEMEMTLSVSSQLIGDDPLELVWGLLAPDDAAGVALTVPDEHGGQVLLCTRYGDTMQLGYVPGEPEPIVRPHGDITDIASVSTVNVLRRILSLPVDTYSVPAVAVIASWMLEQVGHRLLATADASSVQRESETMHMLAQLTATVLSDWPGNDVDVSALVAGVDGLGDQQLSDVTPTLLANMTGQAAAFGDYCSWIFLAGSPFSSLLPDVLRQPNAMLWAGDGLAAWWTFNTHMASPEKTLATLAILDPAVAASCAQWLSVCGWWPGPTGDLFAEL